MLADLGLGHAVAEAQDQDLLLVGGSSQCVARACMPSNARSTSPPRAQPGCRADLDSGASVSRAGKPARWASCK
jgi:hypothetical protein